MQRLTFSLGSISCALPDEKLGYSLELAKDWYLPLLQNFQKQRIPPSSMTELPPNRSDQRLVVHDYFAMRGGGERVALTLANGLNATLMYGYRTDSSFDKDAFPAQCIDLGLPKFLQKSAIRVPALAARFSSTPTIASRYKIRIYSGVCAPMAAPDRDDNGTNIFYCHTPPRFLYDQRQHFQGSTNGLKGLVQRAASSFFERQYHAAVARMDVIFANSKNVQSRIKTFLNRDSLVVYPPCPTNQFSWQGQQNYYLSTARLSPLKRIDKIIDAFINLPHQRLIVVSGGEEEEALHLRAKHAPNITFTGWIDEARMKELIGNAIATIYIPVDEDFGMSPVESMAAGKPVIGVAEGGLLETIVPDETGYLLPSNFRAEDISDAVERLTPNRAIALRSACEARALLFSEEKFFSRISEFILR